MNSREHSLLGTVLGFDIVVEVSSNHLAGVVMHTKGLFVSKPSWLLFHTDLTKNVQDEQCPGSGLAGKIVQHALDQAIDDGYRIVAVCPYVKRWIEKQDDPRYQQAQDTARPEHFS